jgi:hypothetical protein
MGYSGPIRGFLTARFAEAAFNAQRWKLTQRRGNQADSLLLTLLK